MSKIVLDYYETLIFDCDGVILNSNKIKTKAFYDTAKIFGDKSALALKNYHLLNGGISRYEKFTYLFTNILCRPFESGEIDELLFNFSNEVKKALLTCEVASNIDELREKTKSAKWMIASGGDQIELREVFSIRGLDEYFDCGIFGSPDDKYEILKREKRKGNITGKCLFLGDSEYDYQVATAEKMDFIFLSQWTEVKNWKEKFKHNVYNDLADLLVLKT